MKIALYVPSWPPGKVPNGIVTYASYMVPALRDLGHEVFIITRDAIQADTHTVDLKNFEGAWTVWHRSLFRIFPDAVNHKMTAEMLRLAINDLVQKHEIDLVEIEESFGWSHDLLGACSIPVIVRLHGPWFLNKRTPAAGDTKRERQEKRGIESAQAVSSPSLKILNTVRSHYDLDLKRAACIPNPIDCVSESEAWSLRKCDADSILFVGRFDEVKGGDLVLQAFDVLAKANPRLRLTFVGSDYGVRSNDGSLVTANKYAERFLSDDIRARLTFLGPVPYSEISALRRSHFVTLCASRSEIFPYSVLEAMSFGCPIVAADVGGISEMIISNRNGILFQSQQLPEMISAVQALLDDNRLAEKLAKQAWNDCRKNFSSGVVADQMSNFYRDVLAGA